MTPEQRQKLMKIVDSEVSWGLMPLGIFGSVTILIGCIIIGCHYSEENGAWQIVKQKGHENYGFVTEMGTGFVLAGFTNKALAITAMEEHREHVLLARKERREYRKPKDDSMWEPVSSTGTNATTEEVLSSMDRAIDLLQKSHSNRAQRAAEYNDRIHQLAYVVSVAGYCAATNGVPFERISNSVHRIVADHFEIK